MKNSILLKAKELHKLAVEKNAAVGAPAVANAAKEWHSYHKVGTGLSLAGLGLSAAAFADSRRASTRDAERKRIEQKSLAALQRIHDALSIKTPPDIPEVGAVKNA